MAFDATKREWSELYAFFKLLSDGFVLDGNADLSIETRKIPVAVVQREEHDGARQYIIKGEEVHIKGENIDKIVSREDFEVVSGIILKILKESREDNVISPDCVEGFLDELSIYNLEAQTNDRTDISIAFYSEDAPLYGFTVRSRLGKMFPLLDGGRTANFKFELTGVKFAGPMVNKINGFGDDDDVVGRMLMIERFGGKLKFDDVADKIFRNNISMIDLKFHRVLGEMIRIMHLDDVTRVRDLTSAIEIMNPHKIKDELINKNGYYRHKVKEFLLASATGMRPAKIYNGQDTSISGLLFVNSEGNVFCFRRENRQPFVDFLYNNTRFEKGSVEKDKYGYLEKENGIYYFKLNLKIGYNKR